MNKKYSIFCIFVLSAQYTWGMENFGQNPPEFTNHNYLEIKELHQHYHNGQNRRSEEHNNMNWKQKTTNSLEQGSWHAMEQIPVIVMGGIVNIGLQKLVNYFESGNAEDAAFMNDINNVEKQEVFRSLLKNQLTQIKADEEELTKQIASCPRTERATLQKLLEQKKEYRTKITQQYHQFAHQHAENVMNFVDKHHY